MPQGKPAGVPCIQLDEQLRCKIFGQPARPAVCGQLQASVEMCGPVDDGGLHARAWLMRLEDLTRPHFESVFPHVQKRIDCSAA